MLPRQEIPEPLLQLAQAQGWVVSVEQCRLLGLGRRSVDRLRRDGQWVPLANGILTIRPGAPTELGRQWAALLAAGPQGALAGRTAAQLWGFGPGDGSPIEVVVPEPLQRATKGDWRIMRTSVPFRVVGDPPRTTAERTALDLCRDDPQEAIGILTRAVNTRRTTSQRILRELELFPRFPQRALVKAVLGDVGEGALSYLEVQYLREVERAHGLPKGERQTRGRAGIRDVRYGRLVVELDGRLGHQGLGVFRDMKRDNLHLLSGEVTLRFGYADVVHRPCEVAQMIAAVLRMLGEPVGDVTCRRHCSGQDRGWAEIA